MDNFYPEKAFFTPVKQIGITDLAPFEKYPSYAPGVQGCTQTDIWFK